ncbi:hypothetical protein [Vreelandella titanicae]|uniref:hypothetical protein n=1 Tax=Vreelandella titanicae TaxID=664683 RepID=UPI001592EF8E|nr:hypothetical protein [Halomonas titanicae]NVE91549.1 hypothetical protein [Halomonas titanicae]|tara:strand:+ start:538 stop:1203 length:666 start_codon:yes stop_codon:yes gene_type:complete
MPSKKTGLVETIKSEQTHELLANGADALIDTLSDSDIVGNIPFVGTVLKTYQAAQGIRERMLVKKLAKFLEYPSQMTEEEKLKFSSQFEDTSKEEEFGEQILVLLEKSEDTEKPRIIGRILVAHARGHFDYSTFMRISKMVNRAFTEDFDYLKKIEDASQPSNADIENSLYSSGFLRQKSSEKFVFHQGMPVNTDEGYELTDYGQWMIKFGLTTEPIPPSE